MSSFPKLASFLIVEPNLELLKPYSFLNPKKFNIIRVSNPLLAKEEINEQSFDLVFLSCSFSSKKLLSFLEFLNSSNKLKIIPLILVVDFNKPYSLIPGLSWNKQLGLVSSLSSQEEIDLNLKKLL